MYYENEGDVPIKQLIVYSLVVIFSGWVGYTLDVLLGNSPTTGLSMLCMMLLPTLTLLIMSRKKLRTLGFSLSLKHYKLYLFCLLFDVVIFAIITYISYISNGIEEKITASLLATILFIALTSLPALFIKNIFEELNWRGFLFPRLLSHFSFRTASVITGVIWASWHLAMWLVITPRAVVLAASPYESITAFIVTAFIALINMSFLYNRIRLLTHSLWPTVLLHTVNNTIVAALYSSLSFTSTFLHPGANGVLYIGALLLVNVYLEWKHPIEPRISQ